MNILKNIEFNYIYEGLKTEKMWGEHNAYTVEISYNGVTEKFKWHQGLGIKEDPTLEDVMECLIMDLFFENEEIYSMYDEEKARKVIKESEKQNNKMNNLFSENELTEIYDYFY